MAKYHIDKVKKLKFARYGGLSSVNQRGYNSNMPTFHSPPASRGFYCFVWPYYELFLLGAPETMYPYLHGAKFSYVRDKNGNIVDDKHPEFEKMSAESDKVWSCPTRAYHDASKNYPDYEDPEYKLKLEAWNKEWKEKHSDSGKWVLVRKPKPRIFEFDGVLWHHLGANLKQSDIIETNGDWCKSTVRDYRIALEKEMHNANKYMMGWNFASKYRHLPTRKSALRYASKDHLECFIEKL